MELRLSFPPGPSARLPEAIPFTGRLRNHLAPREESQGRVPQITAGSFRVFESSIHRGIAEKQPSVELLSAAAERSIDTALNETNPSSNANRTEHGSKGNTSEPLLMITDMGRENDSYESDVANNHVALDTEDCFLLDTDDSGSAQVNAGR
jgi:hypothetical protein